MADALKFLLGALALITGVVACSPHPRSGTQRFMCHQLPTGDCRALPSQDPHLVHCLCRESEWWLASSPFDFVKATGAARELALQDWVEDWYWPTAHPQRALADSSPQHGPWGQPHRTYVQDSLPAWEQTSPGSAASRRMRALLRPECAIFHLESQVSTLPAQALATAECPAPFFFTE